MLTSEYSQPVPLTEETRFPVTNAFAGSCTGGNAKDNVEPGGELADL
jgi:hypothetical protein